MEKIISIFQFISGLGPAVMMPIIIFILALVFRVKFSDALRAGLTIGVGFIGLNLIVGIMGDSLGEAVQTITKVYGLNLSVMDVGWPGVSAVAFAGKAGAMIIPLCLLTNIIMLLTNTTQTMDVDIWNFWHYALVAAFVEVLTGSFWLAIFISMLNFAIVLIIADYSAPAFEKNNDMPGVSIPNAFAAAYWPIAVVLNKLIDKIPVIRDIDINLTEIQKKVGVFGEPIFIGTVLGILMGVIARYEIGDILTLGITMGAVLVLIPKMAALLMDGLLPISEAASTFIEKRFSKRGKIYIGLDSAVGIGHPVTLAVSLILVPIVVFLAVIIPGNQMVPFVDLAVIPYMFVLIIPVVKSNGFRSLVIGTIVLAVGLLFSTSLADLTTQAAKIAGVAIPNGALKISSICDGSSPLLWIFVKFMQFPLVGTFIIAAITLLLSMINRSRILREAKTLHND
ncbi:PTS transporter subunit IIC [Vagococcus fluvialis]|uniref:PTS galactitol transporter subunit IIC n=1 Tax=Vagococcus fluvialis TaxID=2738 RepID=UPI00288DD46B|nr:PTS transporter subunit IIC [Vagococcus fluvialis]MDT2782993.1 PTS transporter subunit IIC [Vagococcus fluvialis]